jgi:hypothetical protein
MMRTTILCSTELRHLLGHYEMSVTVTWTINGDTFKITVITKHSKTDKDSRFSEKKKIGQDRNNKLTV